MRASASSEEHASNTCFLWEIPICCLISDVGGELGLILALDRRREDILECPPAAVEREERRTPICTPDPSPISSPECRRHDPRSRCVELGRFDKISRPSSTLDTVR
jgi:hypothetical protein